MRRRFAGLVLGCAVGGATVTLAQSIDVSPDTTVTLSGTLVGSDKAATDNQAGTVTPVGEPFVLPSGANLTAFDRLPEGYLFSPDITVNIQGVVVGPGDVALYTANVPLLAGSPARLPKLLFSAVGEGLPAGVQVDAVSRESNGALLLSFDTTVVLDGITLDDEDVALVPATGTASMVFDGSARGVPEAADLDGLHRLLPSGDLLLSLDISGSVGGVAFDDEDALRFTPGTGSWSMFYDGSAHGGDWSASDLDATATPHDTDADGTPDGKDNCGLLASSQLDNGGVGTAVPDGIGNDCQCGDVTGNGIVTSTDSLRINQAALNIGPFSATAGATQSIRSPTATFLVGRCNVNTLTPCTGADGLRVSQASLGLPPGILLTCPGEVYP